MKGAHSNSVSRVVSASIFGSSRVCCLIQISSDGRGGWRVLEVEKTRRVSCSTIHFGVGTPELDSCLAHLQPIAETCTVLEAVCIREAPRWRGRHQLRETSCPALSLSLAAAWAKSAKPCSSFLGIRHWRQEWFMAALSRASLAPAKQADLHLISTKPQSGG